MKLYEQFMWQCYKGIGRVTDPNMFGLVLESANNVYEECEL